MRGSGGSCGKYQRVVDSLNRLAQHLAGLRSSCGLQHEIMMKQREHSRSQSPESAARTKAERIAEALSAKSEYAPPTGKTSSGIGGSFAPVETIRSDDDLVGQANAYQLYLDSIGPHMRSLVFTCCKTLKGLRTAFASHKHHEPPSHSSSGPDDSALNRCSRQRAGSTSQAQELDNSFSGDASFDSLSQDLRSALQRFRHEQIIAVKHVYTIYPDSEKEYERFKKDPKNLGGRSDEGSKDKPDEEIFVVFFYMFNLDELAKELEELVGALEEIRLVEHEISDLEKCSLMRRLSWSVSSFFTSSSKKRDSEESFGKSAGEFSRVAYLQISKLIASSPPLHLVLATLLIPSASSARQIVWPSNRSHEKGTQQTQLASTLKQKLSRVLWSIGEFLRQPDTKFSIKAGVGCAILASPAFMHALRPTFVEYKGQWALVSFMVVLSTTVGQSNQMR